jgi:anaerobic ribonucleoside-triphosphate reductase activating protein
MVRSKLLDASEMHSAATAELGAVELNLHHVLPQSSAHGPGVRCVLWVQGCSLACPGCCSPGSHDAASGSPVPVEDLLRRLEEAQSRIDGVTLSGGEPLEQPAALLELLHGLRARTRLSVVLSTGYELAEVEAQPLGPRILARVDVVIAGRFVRALAVENPLIGSSNRRVYLLSERYDAYDIAEAVSSGR